MEDTQPWAWHRRGESAEPGGLAAHHCSRPMSPGSFAPPLLLRQQAEILAQPALSPHPHFKQGHPSLVQPSWKRRPTTHPCMGERLPRGKGRASSPVSFLAAGHGGGTTPHLQDGSHSQEPRSGLGFRDPAPYQE